MDEKKLQNLLERAFKSDPPQLGHLVQGGYMTGISPVKDEFRVIGPAFTIRIPTNDNSMYYYAVKHAPKGSVIVVDRMGEKRYANIGENAVRAAILVGAAGIIVDGPNTDTLALRKLNFPVFSTGRAAACNSMKGVDGEFNVPVCCGGAVVQPGDIVFGDIDGIVVVPPDRLEELLIKAEEADRNEVVYREEFEKGNSIYELVNVKQLVETGIGSRIGELLKFDEQV